MNKLVWFLAEVVVSYIAFKYIEGWIEDPATDAAPHLANGEER